MVKFRDFNVEVRSCCFLWWGGLWEDRFLERIFWSERLVAKSATGWGVTKLTSLWYFLPGEKSISRKRCIAYVHVSDGRLRAKNSKEWVGWTVEECPPHLTIPLTMCNTDQIKFSNNIVTESVLIKTLQNCMKQNLLILAKIFFSCSLSIYAHIWV